MIENSDEYDLSYKGIVRAANTDGVVSWTHEVFDLEDAVAKTGQDEERPGDPLRYDYKEGETYHAMNPISQNDSQSDLNKAVNNRVATNSETADPTLWKDYAPPAFGPN